MWVSRTVRRMAGTAVVAATTFGLLLVVGPQPAEAVRGSGAVPADRTYSWMGHLSTKVNRPLRPDGRADICGATLVTPGWALTAQHCIVDTPADDLEITFSSNQASGEGGWRTSVSEIVRRDGYQQGPLINDLALLRLTSSAPPEVQPVRLALGKPQRALAHVGAEAVILGWGAWAEGPSSDVLLSGSMRLNLIDPVYVGARPVERAYGAWTGPGDSGGPILVREGDELVQVGVVSGTSKVDTQQSVFNRIDPASAHWPWFSSVTGIAATDVVPPAGPATATQGAAALWTGNGFWSVTPDGAVEAFGEAADHGSMAGRPLNGPMIAIAGTPTDAGYWLVGEDGGVFAFGDAPFAGSMGGKPLNAPVVGVASTVSGRGYWLVASDGGVFAFGDAEFLGSLGGSQTTSPVVSITSFENGRGYWIITADGQVTPFTR